jgi:cobyrinic acid a,c-diamide synthase
MVARLVVAGVASGVGKTTTTVALARALSARGLRVALFKCGPDYLDPTYHERATGSPSHNLDGWMMGRDAVARTFVRGARDADVAIIEGVMGLFDGASPTSEQGSTAEIAKWLAAPVIVAMDASGMARTVAAVARGMASFDPQVNIAGFVCNRVGSRGHLELLQAAQRSPPIVGGFPDEPQARFPERHLGLHSADRKSVPEDLFARWGAIARDWIALDLVLEIARSAPPLPTETLETAERPLAGGSGYVGSCRIGLAWDEAFHFYYDDNLRRLEELGATLVRFSPIRDGLPDVDGVYFGGGYPEVHAEALAANGALLSSLRVFAERGGPIYAECGGLMYLARGIRTLDGRMHTMAGLVDGEAIMKDRLVALGYVEVETQRETLLGPPGLRFRGHQFRYSELVVKGQPLRPAYSLRRRRGGETSSEGYQVGNTLASYVHAHWASNPLAARGFVESCTRFAQRDPS